LGFGLLLFVIAIYLYPVEEKSLFIDGLWASLCSGWPLIDNEGKVVGIVTWGSDNDREQFNGARSLDTFCLKIVKCEYEFEGEKTWLDYEE
jgi:hypothetical protein